MNVTGDAAGETYAFVYAKPACLVMKSMPLSRNDKADFDFHSNN